MTNIFMLVFTGEMFEDYCLTETIDEIGNMPLYLKGVHKILSFVAP